jgi:sugar lactone lactonase YvrE
VPEPEVLLEGVVMGESPRWYRDRLWFSDWGAQQIVAVGLDGQREDMARVESLPFSIHPAPDGSLLVVAAAFRQILRREGDGTLVPVADLAGVSEHPWNEIVVDGRGDVFVNNIGFDLMSGAEPAAGLVAVVGPDGVAREVAGDLQFPNGMAVTPDDATLIVAESYAERLTAFTIGPGGVLSDRRVWAPLPAGYPDGICIDAEGAVWYADVPNRRCVRVREGGEVLATVDVDRGCFACVLGGPDRRTLFIVAADWKGPEQAGRGAPTGRILTVAAPAPGAGRP